VLGLAAPAGGVDFVLGFTVLSVAPGVDGMVDGLALGLSVVTDPCVCVPEPTLGLASVFGSTVTELSLFGICCVSLVSDFCPPAMAGAQASATSESPATVAYTYFIRRVPPSRDVSV
jgi:hypothetical protein